MSTTCARFVFVFVLVFAAGGLALSGCVVPRTPLGGQCDLSSDCEAPLVCRFERCRRDCVESRDCPLGLACVLDENKQGACLIVEETRCASAAACPDPLVCSFGRCTNRCTDDRDCVAPQRCEMDPVTGTPACFASAVEETPCVTESDCEGNQRCYPDGRCRPECIVDRDCDRGERCVRDEADMRNNFCVVDLDAGLDGGVMMDGGPRDAGTDGAIDGGMDAGGFDGGPAIERPCETPADCTAPNATTDCVGGFCSVLSCDPGFADCDRDPLTGCHAALDSWIACGSCANLCGAGVTCASGSCGTDAIASIASGYAHTCVVRSSGTVACWGLDLHGQLGDGAITRHPEDMNWTPPGPTPAVIYPSVVVGVSDAVEVAGGRGHTCVRHAGGTVSCWGDSALGQVGPGATVGADQLTPVPVPGLSGVAELGLGSGHSCVRLASGEVRCWGYNAQGRLGNDSTTDSVTPVTVVDAMGSTMPLSSVTDLAVGASHACVVLGDGTARCWGTRNRGELGDGGGTGFTLAGRAAPVPVVGLTNAVEIEAGSNVSCARLADGTVRCWGLGGFGTLGDGAGMDSSSPVTVAGITTAVELSGFGYHFCARLADGTMRCWGRNENGAIGDGTMTAEHSTPVAVLGLGDARDVAAGFEHTCALRATGTVDCWGSNSFGQLGDLTIGCCGFIEGDACFSGCGVTRPQPAEAL